ncbi:hypothetical protein BH10PSE17_BH10PSE17_28430 [soil metagenome]
MEIDDRDAPTALLLGDVTPRTEALARALGESGHGLIVAADDEAIGRRLVESIRAGGTRAEFVYCEPGSASDLELMVAVTIEAFGRIDLAIVVSDDDGDLGRLVAAVAPLMREQREGGVISVTPARDAPGEQTVRMLAQALAGDRVRVNAVTIVPSCSPLPAEVASVVLWLAGREARSITGSTVTIGLTGN